MVFSPDGKVIASVGTSITLWDVSSYKLIRQLSNPYAAVGGCSVATARFSPDGNLLAASMTGCWEEPDLISHLVIWDMASGELFMEGFNPLPPCHVRALLMGVDDSSLGDGLLS